jgi:nitrate reductase NapE component
MSKIDLLFMLGGLLAALAVSAVCGLGLVVWLAGGKTNPPK